MIFTVYELATGHITNTFATDSIEDLNAHLNGRLAIEGEYDSNEFYIHEGTPVAKSTKPGPEYTYNYATHTWDLDTVYLTRFSRINRNQLLGEIDAISATRYNSLTAEQQSELQQYRQALLDVPQQTGFPITIDWPSKPAWL